MVQVTVNGVPYTIGTEESLSTRLVSFIRETVGLTGTHYTCFRGGCGACTVVATAPDPDTGGTKTFSLNSCLALLYNCDGWEITTTEGLGNEEDGYHVIQERLADHYGTQCGYCSPGMVMYMYGQTKENSTWTKEQIEKNLDGNICRCTGYRPILDAFKSITPSDIEESEKALCSKRAAKAAGGCCKDQQAKKAQQGCCGGVKASGGCCRASAVKPIQKKITVGEQTWFNPTSTEEMLDMLKNLPSGTTYRFVFGNTATGVAYSASTDAIISTRNVADLAHVFSSATDVTAGAAVSLTTLMAALSKASSTEGFSYLSTISDHWMTIGGASVRNLGCWAGNLGLKMYDPSFPSDIVLDLVAARAQVQLGAADGTTSWVAVEDLLNMDLTAKRQAMLQLKFLPLSANSVYSCHESSPRNCMTLSYVNATFNIESDPSSSYKVTDTPVLAFGNINDTFVRATDTESYLLGKNLQDEDVLQGALSALAGELKPSTSTGNETPEFRIQLAQCLLYKMLLSVLGDSGVVDPSIASGAGYIQRPLTSGTQTYDDNKDTWPLGQPIPKLEAYMQCSGEAKYAKDLSPTKDELYGMFVQSTVGDATLDSIDASAALAAEGIVGFVSAADIPGENNIYVGQYTLPLFASDKIEYNGQALGVLVGTSSDACRGALHLVKATYSNVKKPVLTIAEAMANGLSPDQPDPFVVGDVDDGFKNSTHIVQGSMNRNGQYHFHMETQTARVSPNQTEYDVVATTQWPTFSQLVISQVLGIETKKVNLAVRRLGGAFGGKIDVCNIVIAGTAVAAHKLRKPVQVSLDLGTNMTMIGWRDPFLFNYKVGMDDSGKLQAIEATMVGDSGFSPADATAPVAPPNMPSCYDCPNWKVTPLIATTNTASNTSCRTPGTVEGITFMEYAMEHAAAEMKMDPLDFRKLNLIPDGGKRMANSISYRMLKYERMLMGNKNLNTHLKEITILNNQISDMITKVETDADVDQRKVDADTFNKENRWRKRGVALMPMLWPYDPTVAKFGVFIAISPVDGSVAIAHGGIEMGQGLNTKVAQVTAYTLGCPLDVISVKATNTVTGANSTVTGGSTGSDVASCSAQHAAAALRKRLDPYVQDGDTWVQTVDRARLNDVSLNEYYWNASSDVKSYSVYGVCSTEVELDVLTGKYMVLRTDILEDAGTSPSPLVDIGQCEGAFVFGQGLFMTEEPKYDADTGARISNSVWQYYPPMAQDIPTDLRVTLLQNTPNPDGVLGSKVTNEPPLCLSFAITLALRVAITSARADAGNTDWFQMDCPLTVSKIQQLCLVDPTTFSYK